MGEPGLTTFSSQGCPWKIISGLRQSNTHRGVPGSGAYDKKNHQIGLKVSKNWPSIWLCPRKFQRNFLGLGSLVGLGSFAVRPGSCPFFRQIKRKGITLSFKWSWSFTIQVRVLIQAVKSYGAGVLQITWFMTSSLTIGCNWRYNTKYNGTCAF